MAIVFPTSPTLNQQFSSDNKVWQWDGEKWTFVSSNLDGSERVGIACSDETTAINIATNVASFRMPNSMTITQVRAFLTTASSSGAVTVDINVNGFSILSTKITIDQDETTSVTAAVPPVISDTSINDDDIITVDVDGSGTNAAGLKIWLIGNRP